MVSVLQSFFFPELYTYSVYTVYTLTCYSVSSVSSCSCSMKIPLPLNDSLITHISDKRIQKCSRDLNFGEDLQTSLDFVLAAPISPDQRFE